MALRENNSLTSKLYKIKSNIKSERNIIQINQDHLLLNYKKELERSKKNEQRLINEIQEIKQSYKSLTDKYNKIKLENSDQSENSKYLEQIKV